MGWPRIAIYILGVLLLVHVLKSFSTVNMNEQDTAVSNESVHDFPWYDRAGHPSLLPLQPKKYTTTHLSVEERTKLKDKMILKAKELVQHEFKNIQGIPGSVFHGDTYKAVEFRSLVDCWTQGEWIKEQNSFIMPHFQDPLYGSCDRKYAKQHKSGYRDAVKYVWKSKCDLGLTMDSANWCETLRGRHLLLVGDLVQYQLHEIFLDTLRDGPAICFGELNCKGKFIQSPLIHLYYVS
jgi:hypothetical protein